TKARGGCWPRGPVIGSLMLIDAVRYVATSLFINTAPIMAPCRSRAIAPRLADQASVRGDTRAKKFLIPAGSLGTTFGGRGGSVSIAANSFCMARPEGAPRLSLCQMVSAYSSRIAAYCRASSGLRVIASPTRRASRASSLPVTCHGSSISISLGASSTFLLNAIVASLVARRLPLAVRQVLARTECASSTCCSGTADDIDDLPPSCETAFKFAHLMPLSRKTSQVRLSQFVHRLRAEARTEMGAIRTASAWQARGSEQSRRSGLGPQSSRGSNGPLGGLVGTGRHSVRSAKQNPCAYRIPQKGVCDLA